MFSLTKKSLFNFDAVPNFVISLDGISTSILIFKRKSLILFYEKNPFTFDVAARHIELQKKC